MTQALAETAIVTLRGVAGVGKTRLALEVARADAAHVVWVDLAPRGARSGIAHAALAALGSLASATGDAEVDVGLALARAPAGTWVILDNFEHLVACAGIVDVWSAKAPSVRFLVTSREALGLPTEAIVDLAPLPHASACRLFTHRADVGGVAADDPAVGALVDHLDRLPLALELAAARVGELGVGELSERIAARLDLLVRRPPGSVSQHSTLRGAFDTSWDLLSPVERQVFARCSVFAATFDAEALRVVVGAAFPLDRSAEETPAVDRAIDGLVRRSFLQRDGGELRMLDSLRAYGREKLALLGVENEAWAAHRAFVLGRARAAAAVQITPAELVKVRALRPDLEQVWARAVAPDDRAVAALGLSRILGEEGPFDQRLDLLRAAALDDARPELRWRLWRELSNAERNLGVEGFGQTSAQRSLAIVEGLPPGTERDQGRVMAWLALAGALGRQGAFAEARARYEAAWRLADQTGVVGAGRAAHGLAEVAFYDGEPYSVVREACARAERSLPRTNSLMRGYLLDFWGMVAADAGAFAEADGLFQDAVVHAASGSAGLDVNVRWRRSWRLRWRGRDAEAEALLAELAADPSVAPPVRILVPVERSLWALAAGQLDAASDHVDQALAMSALPAYSAMFARFHRGRVDHAMGRFADAEARYAAAVREETPVSARISRVFHAMALADLDRPQLAREPLGIVAADVAERGSVALRALVAVAEAVVQVAEARAGQVPWATAEAAVDAAFAAAGVTLPGGFVLGRCHLDLVVATCLLRRTLARTAERPASG